MGLKLTTDMHPPIISQTRYRLGHAAYTFIDIDTNGGVNDLVWNTLIQLYKSCCYVLYR